MLLQNNFTQVIQSSASNNTGQKVLGENATVP